MTRAALLSLVAAALLAGCEDPTYVASSGRDAYAAWEGAPSCADRHPPIMYRGNLYCLRGR
ncbi:MAG: hypothetical protein AAFR47_17265 [Pseudomonadota bacterium]